MSSADKDGMLRHRCSDVYVVRFKTDDPGFPGIYDFEYERRHRSSVSCRVDDPGCPKDLPITCASLSACANSISRSEPCACSCGRGFVCEGCPSACPDCVDTEYTSCSDIKDCGGWYC